MIVLSSSGHRSPSRHRHCQRFGQEPDREQTKHQPTVYKPTGTALLRLNPPNPTYQRSPRGCTALDQTSPPRSCDGSKNSSLQDIPILSLRQKSDRGPCRAAQIGFHAMLAGNSGVIQDLPQGQRAEIQVARSNLCAVHIYFFVALVALSQKMKGNNRQLR